MRQKNKIQCNACSNRKKDNNKLGRKKEAQNKTTRTMFLL